MSDRKSVAIVGAGMAGLACASRLVEAGIRPVVLDKGRGPGGRMAARRIEIDDEVVSFDHGAQYFTARDPEFRTAVEHWHALHVVKPWPAAGEDAWVGIPGMNGPIRAMAEALDVDWGARVERITREPAGWAIRTAERQVIADHVMIAIPAEQASELLAASSPELASISGATRSEPCWAVMVAFKQRLPIAVDTLREVGAKVSWAARNSSKPARAGTETWVLHASPARSRELLNLEKDEVARMLLSDFFDHTGIDSVEPIHLVAHRWLYAMANAVAGEPARYDANARIGIAGDYLHSPRVEGAFLSGRALADRLLAELD